MDQLLSMYKQPSILQIPIPSRATKEKRVSSSCFEARINMAQGVVTNYECPVPLLRFVL